MCGICGYWGPIPNPNLVSLVQGMTACLGHRGPDGQGAWHDPDGRAGLGHTRLAVLDIAGGVQPMVFADGRHVIVFNGEIYNFREVRRDLERVGRRFRTRSDTEVLLAAYVEWGLDSLARLEGMFAFAVFDTRELELTLVRDRVGIKPLYYHDSPNRFVFASEIKALLGVPGIPRRMDHEALVDFLVLGYPLAPRTFFKDVHELPPGGWVRVSSKGIERGNYWKWQRAEQDWDDSQARLLTKETLIATLQTHLVADVPIGALLSGGIDSSLLVAMLSKELGVQIETFTVRFAESQYDESPHARAVAQHLELPYHEVPVLSAPDGVVQQIHGVMDQFDQPFADSSAIPTFLICREIRKHVKVAIGGDGGDEMFGGYPRFYYADIADLLGRLPSVGLGCLNLCRRPLTGVAPDLARQLGRILRAARHGDRRRLIDLSCYNYPSELPAILTEEAYREVPAYVPDLGPSDSEEDSWNGRQLIDATIRCALPGDYLRKIDVMSSAHGLEVRVPFLGDRVLQLSSQLPHRLKYNGLRNGKRLLRELLREYLPEEISERPKSGFGIPLDTYLDKAARKTVGAMLTAPDARVRRFVSSKHVDPLVRGFVNGTWPRARWSRYAVYQQVYMLWGLERWLQKWEPTT